MRTSSEIVFDLYILLGSHAVESGNTVAVVVPVGTAPGGDCTIGRGWVIRHFHRDNKERKK
jgi:hypothetical protein